MRDADIGRLAMATPAERARPRCAFGNGPFELSRYRVARSFEIIGPTLTGGATILGTRTDGS
jgi:hypothetical protein